MSNSHRQSHASSIAYLNGQWLLPEQMQISIGDLGFLQAVTAVERMRTYGGRLFQREAHLQRLQHTLEVLQIPASMASLESLLSELLERNAGWIAAVGDVAVTLFVTPGSAQATHSTIGLHCNRLDHQQIARRQRQGQAIVLTEVQQPSPLCWSRQIKVRCRLHYYLADQAAGRVDRDALGVLMDEDRTLTETSVANLAIVRGEQIVTPPPERVLRGVTQQFLEAFAAQQAIDWIHQPVSVRALEEADEILLFGTTTGVWNGWLAQRDQGPPRQAMSQRLRAAFPC